MDWSFRRSKSLTKAETNHNYIVRRLNTNKTQILHRIRLTKFVPNVPLEDKYKELKLQPDESIIIPRNDLYTISWEADFEYELFEPRSNNWPDAATRLLQDATNGDADYYVTEDERCSTNEDECSSEERNESDVTENQTKPRSASSRDATSLPDEPPNRTVNENDVTNDLESTEIASFGGADITVPRISENEKNEENLSPREGKNNIRPNPTPNFTEEYRY